MVILKRFFFFLMLFSLSFSSQGQEVEVVHGISISFGFPKKARFVVSYNVHVRSHLDIADKFALTPFVDVKLSLFKNHLGSSVLKSASPLLYLNTAITYGNLISYSKRDSTSYYYVPTFTSTYHNNPNSSFKYNLGIASTESFQFSIGDADKQPIDHQQVANYMFNIKDFYLNYFNDGGDPLSNFFGDGKDRYWTAGLTMGYTIRRDEMIEQVQLSFDQFTGYNRHSYETAGYLFVDNVPYSDTEQLSYNSSRVSLKYHNLTNNIGGAINFWGVGIQDWIHKFVTNSPFHSRLEKKYKDFEFFWNHNFEIDE